MTVDVPVPDSPPMRVHRFVPDDPRGSSIVLLHELFGVDDGIRQVAEQLTGAGHTVLVPELYHRTAAPGLVLARDDEGRAEGFRHLGSLGRDQVLASVGAAMATADDVPRTGLLGFSAGAHAAYLVATRLPLPVTVCVYPGWLTGGPVPISGPPATIEATPGLQGRVVVLVGDQDHVISTGEVDRVESALEAAEVDHDVIRIPGAGHAFFWPGTPSYDESARTTAWTHVIDAFDAL